MLSIENKSPVFNNSMFKRYLYCSIDLDIMTSINMTFEYKNTRKIKHVQTEQILQF